MDSTKLFVSVDPGADGAAVVFAQKDIVEILPFRQTAKRPEWILAFVDLLKRHKPSRAVIESVHAMPAQGVASMFNFGRTSGLAEGALIALCGHQPDKLHPQAWYGFYRLRFSDYESLRHINRRQWQRKIVSLLYPKLSELTGDPYAAILIGRAYWEIKLNAAEDNQFAFYRGSDI